MVLGHTSLPAIRAPKPWGYRIAGDSVEILPSYSGLVTSAGLRPEGASQSIVVAERQTRPPPLPVGVTIKELG